MPRRIQDELINIADKERASAMSRYFKTAKGEYGEGDVFLGVPVGEQRVLVKKYFDLKLNNLSLLLSSDVHEFRFSALLILLEKYKKSREEERGAIFDFYIKNINYINNWDLVDLSAPNILGDYLFNKKRDLLYRMIKSSNVWERRLAIVSTHFFIKNNDLADPFSLSEKLLLDKHDLIHKAVGWTLRETGKKDMNKLEFFLYKNKDKMPRVMLRYSIEKMSEEKRRFFLKK